MTRIVAGLAMMAMATAVQAETIGFNSDPVGAPPAGWQCGSTGGGTSRWNLRNLLVVAQIAVSLLLLIGSGLFLKAFHKAKAIDPGFRTSELALLSFDLSLAEIGRAHV